MKAARFDYLRPGDVGEALAALAKANGGAKLFTSEVIVANPCSDHRQVLDRQLPID